MSIKATLKIAPILRVDNLEQLRGWGRTVYSSHTFKNAWPNSPCPVVIDHDAKNVIGRVDSFFEAEWVEEGRWAWADITLDTVPEWLRKGTGVSFAGILQRKSEVDGVPWVMSQMVREVTLCSPAFKPCEPLAKVMVLREAPSLPAAATAPVTAGETLYSERERQHAAACAERGLIYRPHIGSIIALR